VIRSASVVLILLCGEFLAIIDVDDYRPQKAGPEADDSAHEWLFDSSRSYPEQMRAYKEQEGNPEEAGTCQ